MEKAMFALKISETIPLVELRRIMMRMCVVLAVCAVVIWAIVAPVFPGNKYGYTTTHDDCHAPCTTETFTFYECFHTTMDPNDPCETTQYIKDELIYAKCVDGAPNETGQCQTEYDSTAVFGRQEKWQIYGPLPCGSATPSSIPGQPTGNCVFVTGEGQHDGRCFLSGSQGGWWLENGAPRLGRDKCT